MEKNWTIPTLRKLYITLAVFGTTLRYLSKSTKYVQLDHICKSFPSQGKWHREICTILVNKLHNKINFFFRSTLSG